MYLVVTIDTEEDNWARYSATDNPVANIEELIPLQRLFDRYGVRPTYLISYPVATHPRSVAILKGFLDQGKCEIGMHCHPWNTPPFDPTASIAERDTMLCNLDPRIQSEKLAALRAAIVAGFGVAPRSFRAGRWGLGPGTVEALYDLGLRVDSSVTPFIGWQAYQGPDHSSFGPELFWLVHDSGSIRNPILEVPVTVGFLQSNFKRCQKLLQFAEQPLLRRTRIIGILYYMGLLNKVWLSPEHANGAMMIAITKRFIKNGYPVINLSFHSTTLKNGLNSVVPDEEHKKVFSQRIEEFLTFANDIGLIPLTLSQLEQRFRQSKTDRLVVRHLTGSSYGA